MTAALAERPCAWCGEPFVPRAPHQRFDSDGCRYRAKEDSRATSAHYRLTNRERCRQWAAEHRGVKRPQPWLYGQPVCEPYLPGGGLEMYVDTPLKWPLEHRNIRGLHGAITAITGEHHPTVPRFALAPWYRGVGWSLYVGEDGLLRQLAGTRHRVRIYAQHVELRFGGAMRIKAPVVRKRGRRRLRIDAVTPCVVRNACHGHRSYRTVNPANLLNTLCAWLPRRVGVEIGDGDARQRVVEQNVRAERVDLGGKYPPQWGWVGHVVVECNAVTEWLWRVAEVIGYGGRVSFGFGRVRVTSL